MYNSFGPVLLSTLWLPIACPGRSGHIHSSFPTLVLYFECSSVVKYSFVSITIGGHLSDSKES
eukprot:6165567-Amphidinium_carterae.4